MSCILEVGSWFFGPSPTARARVARRLITSYRLIIPSMPTAARPLPKPAKPAAGSASPVRALTRQDRADQLKRARASARVLGAAFPAIERLRIELTFEDPSSTSPAAQVHTLYPPARAFFTYVCPHSDCDGEFELEGAARLAVSDSSRIARGSLLCGGMRPGEVGSKRPCALRLSYAITARFPGGARSSTPDS